MFSLAVLAFLHSNPPIATSTPSTLLACRYKCKWVLSLAPYAPKSFRSTPRSYLPELVFTILWCRCIGRKTRSRSPHPRVPSRANLGSKPRSSSKVHTPQAPDTSEPTTSLSASLSLSLSLSLSVCPLRSCLGSIKTKQVVGGVQDATFPCVISVLGPIGGELFPTISQQALFLVCFCLFLHTTRVLYENKGSPSFP